MTIKAKDLMDYDIKPFLYGLLFSRIVPKDKSEIPNEFYVYTNFRASKAVNYTDFNLVEYSEKLLDKYNRASGYKNWEISRVTDSSMELRFPIINNLELTVESFYSLVYKRLMQESWLYDELLTEDKKKFMRGYMEPRGSIDLTRPLISQDYFYNNPFELKRIQILMDFMNIPFSYLNFNPREMQNDFITGKSKRNTQFRIHSNYYAKEIGFLNHYKALIFEKSNNVASKKVIQDDVIFYNVELPKRNDNLSFIKYLNFFSNNIYKQDLSLEKISRLRESMGFDKDDATIDSVSRNQTIIELFDNISPDKCGLCGTTETFMKKSTQRQAFEIHHVIPFHNGKQFDNIANLVKLCPTCHSSLKRGRSTKEVQIKNIVSILHKNSEIFEYTSSTLGIEDINDLAAEIYTMLG